ncbi:MAG: autoinducer binding domain-containing protein [Deltaproteobacteria bacterium]|nr:autoinducer binding domain-containing protein [Deltaproteobacteria bacterium]
MRELSTGELQSLLETIDRLARCRDADKFEDIFKAVKTVSFLLPYEMSLCAIGNGSSLTVNKLINNKFPQDYLGIYFTPEMIRSNPFVRETLMLARPRFWNAKDYKRNKIVSTKMDIGLNKGISSSLSEANGITTFLCLANPTEKPHQHHLRIVDFLMPHLHHTLSRIYKSSNGNGNGYEPSLSNREAEVIKWVMEGKTNWEISAIMSISEATVKFHLLNIFRKLDVVNRGHAVAKALQIAPHIFL